MHLPGSRAAGEAGGDTTTYAYSRLPTWQGPGGIGIVIQRPCLLPLTLLLTGALYVFGQGRAAQCSHPRAATASGCHTRPSPQWRRAEGNCVWTPEAAARQPQGPPLLTGLLYSTARQHRCKATMTNANASQHGTVRMYIWPHTTAGHARGRLLTRRTGIGIYRMLMVGSSAVCRAGYVGRPL